jgi:hypothetical protein
MSDELSPPLPSLATIMTAADDLMVPSEQDAPLLPFHWPGDEPLTPATLAALLGLAPETPVEQRELEAFFGPLTRTRPWHGPDDHALTERFARLHATLLATLTDPVVYRLGTIEIQVVIVGRDASGALVGLHTTVVET